MAHKSRINLCHHVPCPAVWHQSCSPIPSVFGGRKNTEPSLLWIWEWGNTSGYGNNWKRDILVIPWGAPNHILTCVPNQKETQKSQAHLCWHMPTEPPHYEVLLPVALAALGERNAVLVLVVFVVLCSFV